MKGPFERLKYDLRRVWECPVCRHHVRTEGSESQCLCRCQERVDAKRLIVMKLVADGVRRYEPIPRHG